MRPKLLTFAAQVARGWLYRAGFDVVGVDIAHQPRYPYSFRRVRTRCFSDVAFDAIHASPPPGVQHD
jgi:DNA (cytosine-5)-methyltransferase 1